MDRGQDHARLGLQKVLEPQYSKASKARWPRWNVPAIPQRGASHAREVLAKSSFAFLGSLSHHHEDGHEGDHDHGAFEKNQQISEYINNNYLLRAVGTMKTIQAAHLRWSHHPLDLAHQFHPPQVHLAHPLPPAPPIYPRVNSLEQCCDSEEGRETQAVTQSQSAAYKAKNVDEKRANAKEKIKKFWRVWGVAGGKRKNAVQEAQIAADAEA